MSLLAEPIAQYIQDVFALPRAPAAFADHRRRLLEAGLPDIGVDAGVGALLQLLTGLVNAGRGARLAVEVGTLGGGSAMWIAQALAPQGRLVTIERDPARAAFARTELARADLARRVEVRCAAAQEALRSLLREPLGQGVDFAFLDADKTEYLVYFELLAGAMAPGGMLVADNALAGGSWRIDDPPGSSPLRDAVDAFNRAVAADGRFDVACAPLRQGLLLARRR